MRIEDEVFSPECLTKRHDACCRPDCDCECHQDGAIEHEPDERIPSQERNETIHIGAQP